MEEWGNEWDATGPHGSERVAHTFRDDGECASVVRNEARDVG